MRPLISAKWWLRAGCATAAARPSHAAHPALRRSPVTATHWINHWKEVAKRGQKSKDICRPLAP